MTLSEMRRVLDERGLRLTRSLGQNFLHDGNQLRRIVAAAELREGDPVLEIGPGLGPLTEQLLAHAGRILAIEKDARLVAFLQERFAGRAGLELRHADALDLLTRERADWRGWKMVSNLPYSVASPILVELADARRGPDLMVTTLQWEVMQRLASAADEETYGVLTLLVGLAYTLKTRFRIPASCFFPEPEVDSACVTLMRRSPPLLLPPEETVFRRLVKRGFSQRRKQLAKLLRTDWPPAFLANAWSRLQLAPEARAESLPLDVWVELARSLSRQRAILSAPPLSPGDRCPSPERNP